MRIHTNNSEEEARKLAIQALAKALSVPDTPILLLASGGSALSLFDDPSVFQHTCKAGCTIAALDERFVDDTRYQNAAQLERTPFVQEMIAAGASFFSSAPLVRETLPEAAARYERFLRSWKQQHPTGRIVATLGVGADGHTAGILPFDARHAFLDLFVLTEAWVCGYRHPDVKHRFTERITPTIPFLLHEIDRVIVYAVSPEKCRHALGVLVRGDGAELHNFPARLLYEHQNAELFTDCKKSRD